MELGVSPHVSLVVSFSNRAPIQIALIVCVPSFQEDVAMVSCKRVRSARIPPLETAILDVFVRLASQVDPVPLSLNPFQYRL